MEEKNEAVHINSNAPCYIIFTSGSTGRPKGCVLTNRGLANFCCNNNILQACNQLNEQICVSVNTISFDFFIAESLMPLLNGYTVVLASEKESTDQKLFSELVMKNRVNIIQTTPTRYKLYFSGNGDLPYTKQIKVIVSGGEILSSELLKVFKSDTNASVFNICGPSECSVWVMGGEQTQNDHDITIGKPIANTQIYILDIDSNPLPVGVAGELCIAGDGVGLGYLNRPELTAERFVDNPFATEENHHGKTMYRTGDLARWRADGEIEYLGRIDTQVKIRGLRIELGEIESVMSGFPGIALCAVTDKKDEAGRQYLVGYYTVYVENEQKQNGITGKIDEKALRQYLSAKLPRYMIPNYFMQLETMPMTPSGKTDRKSLPVPDFAGQKEEYSAPQTDTEKKLADIWRSLLKLPRISRTDDFFELGGDSLLVISLLNEIVTVFTVEMSVKDIMELSTLEQIALRIEQYVRRTDFKTDCIEPHQNDRYILLPQQKAIYAACQKSPDSLLYNMPAKVTLPQEIDRERLKQSISLVMEHTKILKSRIVSEADEVYGIYDENAVILFEKYTEDNEKDFRRPFALEKAPLFRVGFTEDAMLFDIHHIIADGETVNIILRDIAAVYKGEPLPDSRLWYGDYAEYFKSCDFAKHKAFFKKMLDCDFEKTVLPQTRTGKSGGKSVHYQVPETLKYHIKKYVTQNHLTETMFFLGAYGILLSKYTAKKDILTSIILQNRVHTDTREIAGMFVNTLPVHLAIKGDTREYFTSVKEMVLELYRYQELPFWEIANAVGMNDKTVVNTSFVYQADGEKRLKLSGKEFVPQFLETHTAKFDFSMEIMPLEHEYRMRLEYNCEKYDKTLMDELAAAYIRVLERLASESIADISTGISVLSDRMFYRIIEEFNETYVDYPKDKCIHELFEEQVKRTPEKVALVFQNKMFTYRQLDEMSNSLAHFLRKKGVKQGKVVPIIARRSWHIIVAILGILKAGGAYMPLVSDYPKDRIAYILEVTNSTIALTFCYDERLDIENINLGEFDFKNNTASLTNINQPGDICYVIFTSGSTGTPKGVSVCHFNVVNYCNILHTAKICCRVQNLI